MKVFVITKGCYSDYHICAVTLDKEKAELLKKFYTDFFDEAYIEEYDAVEDVTKIKQAIEKPLWNVEIYPSGEVHANFDRYDANVENYFALESDPDSRIDYLSFWAKIVAETKEKAIKIAADKRAELLYEHMMTVGEKEFKDAGVNIDILEDEGNV